MFVLQGNEGGCGSATRTHRVLKVGFSLGPSRLYMHIPQSTWWYEHSHGSSSNLHTTTMRQEAEASLGSFGRGRG